jgi:dTMP kinase
VLLALEGIDGSGKTTQAHLLAGDLQRRGVKVVLTREPGSGPAGRRLRRYLAGPVRHLRPAVELAYFVADRREHVARIIRPALAAGRWVITDRSYYSSVAYQGALGLDPARILALNESFAPRPDLVVILTLPPALAVARLARTPGRRRQVSEGLSYLEQVAAIYAALSGPHIHRLDATASPAVTQAALLTLIEKILKPRPAAGQAIPGR